MGRITVAAAQMACSKDRVANLTQAEEAVREAAKRGAQIILLQEFFRNDLLLQRRKRRQLFIRPCL